MFDNVYLCVHHMSTIVNILFIFWIVIIWFVLYKFDTVETLCLYVCWLRKVGCNHMTRQLLCVAVFTITIRSFVVIYIKFQNWGKKDSPRFYLKQPTILIITTKLPLNVYKLRFPFTDSNSSTRIWWPLFPWSIIAMVPGTNWLWVSCRSA